MTFMHQNPDRTFMHQNPERTLSGSSLNMELYHKDHLYLTENENILVNTTS